MSATGSTTGQPQFMTSIANQSFSNAPLIENSDTAQIIVPDKTSWKNSIAYMGPGFLVSIAYIDPGNLASCAALIIQSLAANLGVVTGKHLAEHCRIKYPRVANFIPWIWLRLL